MGKSDSRNMEGIVERDRTGWKGIREAVKNHVTISSAQSKGCYQDEGASSVGRRGKPVLEIHLRKHK